MVNEKHITIPQLAKLLGLSRIEVYRRVRKGQIKAEKIGRMYVIEAKEVGHILGKKLTAKDKGQIEKAVKKAIKEYGEVLRKLGAE
jgi:excisionase family DNA binding protein